MKVFEIIRRLVRNSDKSSQLLNSTVAGIDNQSRLLNEKLQEVIEGLDNLSELLNTKLQGLIEGTVNQSSLLNDKLTAIIHQQDILMELHKAEIRELREALDRQGINRSTIQTPPILDNPSKPTHHSTEIGQRGISFDHALARQPLMIGAKTYNTSHPDYDANSVRNFPGKFLNSNKLCNNVVYASLQQLAKDDEIPETAWGLILDDALKEAMAVPQSDQIFARRAYIENYISELTKKYGAHYSAGWVNPDDAIFLYWLVRKLKPKAVVQTGVCNGLSSAFIILGLVKNGSEGKLHAIDIPPVFNSADGSWMLKGKVYGHVIPEGKSAGWMIPDAYRARFELWPGDAKALLPKLVDKLDSIDLFYHDSNHTYDHMMFEFREAKRKLALGGLIVADDIAWNSSLWDFADEYVVPSYNFKGSIGVDFF
jgi:predicted O-methyltransferase YrrM